MTVEGNAQAITDGAIRKGCAALIQERIEMARKPKVEAESEVGGGLAGVLGSVSIDVPRLLGLLREDLELLRVGIRGNFVSGIVRDVGRMGRNALRLEEAMVKIWWSLEEYDEAYNVKHYDVDNATIRHERAMLADVAGQCSLIGQILSGETELSEKITAVYRGVKIISYRIDRCQTFFNDLVTKVTKSNPSAFDTVDSLGNANNRKVADNEVLNIKEAVFAAAEKEMTRRGCSEAVISRVKEAIQLALSFSDADLEGYGERRTRPEAAMWGVVLGWTGADEAERFRVLNALRERAKRRLDNTRLP